MRLFSSQTLVLALVYSLPFVLAQSLIPPSSLPDVPSSTFMTLTTSSSGASATITSSGATSSGSTGSGSGTSSVSATKTSSAQFPSLSGVSDCVNTCLATSVAAANCDDLVGVNCWCPNDRFPLTYFNCVASGCSSDLATAENLVQQFCKQSNVTSATSISFPPFTMISSSQSAPASMTTSSNSEPPATTSSSAASSTRLNANGYARMEFFFVLMMMAVGFASVGR